MILPIKRKYARSGTALFVATASFIFLIPMVGLAVDVGFLYAVRAKLQASVDGASLGAARALSLGASTSAQATSAKQNAVNWFYADFPPGTFGTKNTLMSTADTYVHVYDDTTNPQLRHVDVFASTNVPTLFMRWFGSDATLVNAKGFASRRDVVAMLVLDRSGSMCASGSTPCSKTDTTSSCAAMINAAKLFTGQFAAGRDRIGMISFADNTYHHSAPSTTFQTTLGYTNTLGTGTGEIDSIICHGGTNSAQAFSMAYNDLYQTNLPGALNVVVLETDGQPNTVTVNFWDGTSAGIAAGSACTDGESPTKKTKAGGGFSTLAQLPAWSPSPWNMNQIGTGYMTNMDSTHNLIGGIGVNGSTYWLMYNNWTATKANSFNEVYNTTNPYLASANSTSCGFNGSHNSASDIAWLPTADVYGNSLTGYQSTTLSGGHLTVTTGNIQNAAFNALDSAGTFARTNATIPAYVYTLGFSAAVDYPILQRVANDPDWIGNVHCTAACVTSTTQPQGTFVYAATQQDLVSAFLALSSQILRLNQ